MTFPLPSQSKASNAAVVMITSSAIWGLLAAGLQTLNTIQLLLPILSYLAPLPVLNYGHLAPVVSFLLIYGWITSGLLGVLMILVPRFSGIPFRYGRLLTGGAILWQVGVLCGLTGILGEGGTGIPFLAFLRPVTCIFLVSFLVLGTGITRGLGGSWKSGPLLPRLYLLGALISFPLGLGTAELLLRGGTTPGAVQIIVQLVWASVLQHLWLTPLALVLVFQLIPAMTGRATSSLSLGVLAWITTLGLGGWLSNTLASEGPLPSWLQSAGIVATLLLFVAVLGNGILLQPLLEGKMEEIKRNVVLRFMSVGAWSYLAAYGWLAFLALPGVRQTTIFTMTSNTTQTLLIFLFWGSILSGSVYALLPVSRNMGWPSHPALTWHFWFTSVGAAMMVSGYALAGIFQGLALNDAGVPIGTVASYLRPFLVVILIGQILWWVGQMAFSSLLFSSLLKLFPSTAPMAVFPSENAVSTNR